MFCQMLWLTILSQFFFHFSLHSFNGAQFFIACLPHVRAGHLLPRTTLSENNSEKAYEL